MLASLFMLVGLCASVLAAPEPVKRENASASVSSLLARISSLWEELIPPYSIYTELGGVPATDTGVIGNPSAISILQSQILESGFPAWFSTLAPDAQSWVLGIAMTAATIIPELASLEIEAGLTTITSSTATATATATAPVSTSASTTSQSSGTMIATTKATTTSQVIATTQTSSSASPSTSSSKAGAAPTKVIAGILGAVGFLGLAVAL